MKNLKKILNPKSVKARDLKRKLKNAFRGTVVGTGIYLCTLGGVNASNNYDKDPIDNKPKTGMTYTNTNGNDKNNQDPLDNNNKEILINKDKEVSGYLHYDSENKKGDYYTTSFTDNDTSFYKNHDDVRKNLYHDGENFFDLKTSKDIKESLKTQSSRDDFFGDVVLHPRKQANVLNDYNFTLKYRGSGDLNDDHFINKTDSTLMAQGYSGWEADMDLDGVSSTNSDKQIHLDYRNDVFPYCESHWDVLQTTSEKEITIQKDLAIDQTDIFKPEWTCGDYSFQYSLNDVGLQDLSNSPINFNFYDTTHHAELNKNAFEVRTETSTGISHSINAFFVGDSTLSLGDWYFFETQTDQRVYPGDYSLNDHVHLERYCHFWSDFVQDTVYGYFPILNFYDINNNPIADPQHDDLVLYPNSDLPNPDPYAELPLNYGSECELETDPDISGWPSSMSSDATAYYSDSTNTVQDTTWRKWWIVGEHPIIDSTLGKQIIYELPDITDPVVYDAPQNPLTVNLGDPTSSDVTGIPTFIDNCDGNIPAVQHPDSIYYFGNFLNPQTCDDLKYDIFRDFSATDSSFNTGWFEHHIKVRDIQPPWWTYQPSSYNLQWTPDWEQDILDNIASNPATAQDNSPLYSVSWTLDGGPGSSGCSQFEFPITIPWNAQDSCGNIANPYFQYVNVIENINPVITYMPNDTTINSTQPTNPENTGGYANGYDNTGEDPFKTREDTNNKGTDPSQADFYNYLIWGNQKLIDACGNVADSVQTITVQDTTKPWFTNFTENIYNNEWGYALNPITPESVDDNPEAPVTISINSIDTIYGNSDPLSCGYINDAIIKYTYKTQDPSGNFTTKVQNHHMQETEPPQNPQAPGLMNYIYGDPTIPTDTATATDNSWLVYSTWSIGNTTQNPDQTVCEHYKYDGEFDWILSDRCDNSVSITSPFNVDKPLSVIYEFFPADITVPEGDTIPDITGWPQAIDTLNPEILPVIYHYENELIFQNEFERWWARHWSVEDVCYQFTPDSIQTIIEDLDVGILEAEKKDCSGPAYPNPTTGEIKIPYYGEGNMKFIVFNSTGNKLDEILISNQPTGDCIFKYNFTIFPPGLYLVKFQSVNCCGLIKIVKR